MPPYTNMALIRAEATTAGNAVALLEAADRLLQGLSYENVLARGYAVVRDESGAPVVAAAGTSPGMGVEIQFKDGRVGARLDGADTPPAAPKPRGARRRPGPGQGELF